MPPGKGYVKEDPDFRSSLFDAASTKSREQGVAYTSAGGGEVYSDGTLQGALLHLRSYMNDEHSRTNYSSIMIKGPDCHTRPPQWLEDKLVAIDGTPLTELEQQDKRYWASKYKKELDLAEAVQEVKRQRRFEADNDMLGYVARARRFFGLSVPLDEQYAKREVEARYKLEEEARWLQEQEMARREGGAAGLITRPPASSSAAQRPSTEEDHPIGVLPRGESPLLSEIQRHNALQGAQAAGRKKASGFFAAPWQAIVESVETGKPLTKVANEYRPRVDYYGLDPFLDSAASLVWFSTKCGIAIGLVHGTLKAFQAMNVDVQFLRASGVGVLSILNMSVFASVVKWGGNTALFAVAFCIGDRLTRWGKRRTLPPHDANARSTSNYVVGLAFSGATVGVLPWWVLNDVGLATRMAASGLAVGGLLGLMVGTSLHQLIALNTSRLDATNRQLRRYEALMHRERAWVEQERAKHESASIVWW